MPFAGRGAANPLVLVGDAIQKLMAGLGDLSAFSWHALTGLARRQITQGTLVPILYSVGVRSVPVVAITGLFIGMVLAVQSYGQFHNLGIATQLGGIINISVIRELGPVLAATMLAGRIGSAMAAELATMRVTEQIDALACLGVDPLHYLVVPRFTACVILIPLLTVLADFMGVVGGALICVEVYHIDGHHYWQHARNFVELWDIGCSLVKPLFFGAAIALVSCHRGFRSGAGAEGVGRAATEAFVSSFIAILVLDFFLALGLNGLYDFLWPKSGSRML